MHLRIHHRGKRRPQHPLSGVETGNWSASHGSKGGFDLFATVRSAPGRVATALRYCNFRILWMGASISSIGTWMQKVAQSWLIITIAGSRSAFFLGLESFLGELPLLLFTLVGGVIADRHDQRHMILISQIIQMFAALTLAALVGTGRIHLAHVLALSLIAGCARAFGGPAYQSLIPALVSKDHVPNAVALNSIQFNAARVIGPVLAGTALTAFGMVACFGLNGASFLFVIAAVLALPSMHAPPGTTETIFSQLKEGLRFVRGSPKLITVVGVGFTCAFFGTPLLTFLPIITRDVFHRDAAFYTHLMTFSGAGAVTGALIVAWLGMSRHMERLLLILLALFGAAMVGFAISRRIALSGLILFAAGLLYVMCTSIANSLAQLLAPVQIRGRVVSVYFFAFLGGSPLGNLANGWLVTRIGSVPVMLVIDGTGLIVTALLFYSSAVTGRVEQIPPQLSLPPVPDPGLSLSRGRQAMGQIKTEQ